MAQMHPGLSPLAGREPARRSLAVYCALIAALLLLRHNGRRPGKRAMEMIRFYLLGYATLDELSAALKLAQKSA